MKANKQFINEIKYLLKENKISLLKVISRKENKHLLEYINEWCSFMNSLNFEFNFRTKVWYVINELDNFVQCRNLNCKKKITRDIITYENPSLKYCSHECKKTDKNLNKHMSEITKSFSDEKKRLKVQRRKETNLRLYGNENYRNDQKREETIQIKHGKGVKNPFQANEVKKKIRQINIERYGVPSFTQSDQFIQKIEETNLKKFGKKYYSQTEESKERIKKTCIDKYGSLNPIGNEDVKNKSKETCQRKYNCDFPTQCRDVFLKQRQKYELDLNKVWNDKFGKMKFDSIPEMAFFIYCIDNGNNVHYQPDIQFKYEFKGKYHVYYPDFLVENKIVELKGDHFFSLNGTMICPFHRKGETKEQFNERCQLYEAKHQCMIKNNVKIIRSSEQKMYIKYVEKKFGKKFLNQFKKK